MSATASASPGRWSLRQRLARVLVLTALLPVLLFGMALLRSQWVSERDSLMLRLDANARMSADALDDALQTRLSAVDVAAHLLADGGDVGTGLTNLMHAYPLLLHALYIDPQGRILAARGRDGASAVRAPATLADQPWFQEAHASARPFMSRAFASWTHADEILITLSAPVERDGVRRGAIHASIPVKQLVQQVSENLQRRGFEFLVLDRAGKVVHASSGLPFHQLQEPPSAASLRRQALPSSRPGSVLQMEGLLRTGDSAYVAAVAMRSGWTVVLLAPKQRLLQPLLPRMWMLGALLAITSLGVLWALWRQRCLLRESIGRLLASLHGYALGGRMDETRLVEMPLELQPLASGVGDLAARMNAAFVELQQVLDQREQVIASRTESLRKAVNDLDQLSRTDALTGGLNYRGFREVGQALFDKARASGAPLAVLALDIDHFKAYNDHYGHIAGDGALRRFAGAVRSALLNTEDVLARPGGEEFVVFLPGATGEQARSVAARVVARVRDTEILHEKAPTGRLTVSVGVATLVAGDRELEDLLLRADASLYRAKGAGRDRVGE